MRVEDIDTMTPMEIEAALADHIKRNAIQAENIAREMNKNEALKRGNTALLEALMGMVNQHFDHREDGHLTHTFMSSDEGAIAALIEAGFAEETKRGYLLNYDRLSERMRNEGGQ